MTKTVGPKYLHTGSIRPYFLEIAIVERNVIAVEARSIDA